MSVLRVSSLHRRWGCGHAEGPTLTSVCNGHGHFSRVVQQVLRIGRHSAEDRVGSEVHVGRRNGPSPRDLTQGIAGREWVGVGVVVG